LRASFHAQVLDDVPQAKEPVPDVAAAAALATQARWLCRLCVLPPAAIETTTTTTVTNQHQSPLPPPSPLPRYRHQVETDQEIQEIALSPLERNVIHKYAMFAAKFGHERLEQEIARRGECSHPKFAFLLRGTPLRAYYEQKLREFRAAIAQKASDK
jgi:hypothetical protein